MDLHLKSIEHQELVNLFEKMLITDPDPKRILDLWKVIEKKFSNDKLDSVYYVDMICFLVFKHKLVFQDDLESLIDLIYNLGEKRGNAMSSDEAKKFYIDFDIKHKDLFKVINQVFKKKDKKSK